MILITMHEWLGPKRDSGSKTPAIERIVTFYGQEPARDLLERIKQYQDAYNRKYELSLEFSLRGIQAIPDLPEDLLQEFNVEEVPE